jgi:hypothetical protein
MEYLAEPYELKIAFAPLTPNPSRIFASRGNLIEALETVDRDLLFQFGARIESKLLLEDIQKSSLKSILRSSILAVDDEALKDGDWKKVVGRFLLQGKYKLLTFLEDKNEITDRMQVVALEQELARLAEATEIKRIPSYTPIPTRVLLYDIGSIIDALDHLSPEDSSHYIADGQQVTLNQGFVFNREAVEGLLTKETKTQREEVRVQVKKPDYLGSSMWDIKLRDHVVPAKIDDRVWLERFQNRVEDVRPGDALLVTLETGVSYGFQNEEVAVHYSIVKVHNIVPLAPYGGKQLHL